MAGFPPLRLGELSSPRSISAGYQGGRPPEIASATKQLIMELARLTGCSTERIARELASLWSGARLPARTTAKALGNRLRLVEPLNRSGSDVTTLHGISFVDAHGARSWVLLLFDPRTGLLQMQPTRSDVLLDPESARRELTDFVSHKLKLLRSLTGRALDTIRIASPRPINAAPETLFVSDFQWGAYWPEDMDGCIIEHDKPSYGFDAIRCSRPVLGDRNHTLVRLVNYYNYRGGLISEDPVALLLRTRVNNSETFPSEFIRQTQYPTLTRPIQRWR